MTEGGFSEENRLPGRVKDFVTTKKINQIKVYAIGACKLSIMDNEV